MDNQTQDRSSSRVLPFNRGGSGAPQGTQPGSWVLGSETHRRFVGSMVATAPPGWVVTLEPPRRTPDQNAKKHTIFRDIAKAKPVWNGLDMTEDDWKHLLVVSHARATEGDGTIRLVPDLEGRGLVQLRESTAQMSKARSSSLIEYATAWAVSHGVPLREDSGT